MSWSVSLGRLFGIPVYVHTTFALLLAWVGVVHWSNGGGIQAVAEGLLFVIAIFGCLLLHEIGHALAARRFGIATRDITLLPIGGLARLERMPDRPLQELWVALAGPAVNVMIATILLIGLLATGSLAPLGSLGVVSGSFVERLMWVNLMLVAFNMIPAFPMDGGRVLRALLALRISYVRATRIAATVGKSAALLFGFTGLFFNPFLVLIAVFVWIGASQEAAAVETRVALSGVPVEVAMMTDFHRLHASEPIARAVRLMLDGTQTEFPVFDDGRFVGMLTQGRILEVLAQNGGTATVGQSIEHVPLTVEPGEMLQQAVERMQASGSTTVPVVRKQKTVGVLSLGNVAEFMSLRRALSQDLPDDRPLAKVLQPVFGFGPKTTDA